MTIAEFIAAHPVEFTAVRVEPAPDRADWPEGSRHWKCTLRVGSESMIVPFSQGSAFKDPPTLADVLDCLASDASGVENAESFEEWASDLGYDTDSRKAERTYNAIERQAEGLRRLFGREDARALMFDVERM